MNNSRSLPRSLCIFPVIAGMFLLQNFSALAAEVATNHRDGKITVQISGKPVLVYNEATVQPPQGVPEYYARSGFIHPLYSPSGKVLTDAFPIGHIHQHAIFSAWTQATFKHEVVDFWNQHKGSGTAKHVKVDSLKNNSFEVKLQQVSVKKGPAIDEEWEVTVRNSGNPFIIDFEIEQECATADEVYLHPYHYGGFGFRGSAHWSPEDEAKYEGSMKVLTSEGITDIEASNHTRPKWIAVHGIIDGKSAGFVVMDHPGNFRYPQPVRVHPRMPYFVFSPVVPGSFILRPGFTYEANYRVVTFDGKPEKAKIENWYQTYLGKK